MEISYKYRKRLMSIKSIITIISMSIIGLSCTNQSLDIEDVHEQAIKQNK